MGWSSMNTNTKLNGHKSLDTMYHVNAVFYWHDNVQWSMVLWHTWSEACGLELKQSSGQVPRTPWLLQLANDWSWMLKTVCLTCFDEVTFHLVFLSNEVFCYPFYRHDVRYSGHSTAVGTSFFWWACSQCTPGWSTTIAFPNRSTSLDPRGISHHCRKSFSLSYSLCVSLRRLRFFF